MAKVVVIFGYGSGVADAVLEGFASSGEFKTAIVARTQSSLDAAAEKWVAKGATVKGYAADLSKSAEMPALVERITAELGPIDVVVYNATVSVPYTASPDEIAWASNININSMHVVYNTVLPSYKARGSGAFLLTGGGFAYNGAWSVGLNFQFGAAAKAYYRNFAQSASATHKGDGINVVCMTVKSLVKSSNIPMAVDHDAAFRPILGAAFYKAATAPASEWADEVGVSYEPPAADAPAASP